MCKQKIVYNVHPVHLFPLAHINLAAVQARRAEVQKRVPFRSVNCVCHLFVREEETPAKHAAAAAPFPRPVLLIRRD